MSDSFVPLPPVSHEDEDASNSTASSSHSHQSLSPAQELPIPSTTDSPGSLFDFNNWWRKTSIPPLLLSDGEEEEGEEAACPPLATVKIEPGAELNIPVPSQAEPQKTGVEETHRRREGLRSETKRLRHFLDSGTSPQVKNVLRRLESGGGLLCHVCEEWLPFEGCDAVEHANAHLEGEIIWLRPPEDAMENLLAEMLEICFLPHPPKSPKQRVERANVYKEALDRLRDAVMEKNAEIMCRLCGHVMGKNPNIRMNLEVHFHKHQGVTYASREFLTLPAEKRLEMLQICFPGYCSRPESHQEVPFKQPKLEQLDYSEQSVFSEFRVEGLTGENS